MIWFLAAFCLAVVAFFVGGVRRPYTDPENAVATVLVSAPAIALAIMTLPFFFAFVLGQNVGDWYLERKSRKGSASK